METTQAFIHKSETNFNNQAVAIKDLEVQVGQLAEKVNNSVTSRILGLVIDLIVMLILVLVLTFSELIVFLG